jgi:RND superfamily putative drug exporter
VSETFARAIVAARLPVIVVWVVTAALMAVYLPTLQEAQTGALGQLVPANSRALEAEQLSADLFRFPLASRTAIVERDRSGLAAERVRVAAALIRDVNRDDVPGVRAAGAYGVTNAGVALPFARERGTTTISSLLFELGVSQRRRVASAGGYVRALDAPPSSYVGVTGVIPARAEQAELIEQHLPDIELLTVVLITLIVAFSLRSALAPLVTLATVAVAYVVSVRLVAIVGKSVGVSVPPEVEPIMVALLFGVVTDYALFYMSRFRGRLQDGELPREAAKQTTAELTPLILACGVAVSVGSAALAVADLGFLRAFGPGMALAGGRRSRRHRDVPAGGPGRGRPAHGVARRGCRAIVPRRSHGVAGSDDREGGACTSANDAHVLGCGGRDGERTRLAEGR